MSDQIEADLTTSNWRVALSGYEGITIHVIV